MFCYFWSAYSLFDRGSAQFSKNKVFARLICLSKIHWAQIDRLMCVCYFVDMNVFLPNFFFLSCLRFASMSSEIEHMVKWIEQANSKHSNACIDVCHRNSEEFITLNYCGKCDSVYIIKRIPLLFDALESWVYQFKNRNCSMFNRFIRSIEMSIWPKCWPVAMQSIVGSLNQFKYRVDKFHSHHYFIDAIIWWQRIFHEQLITNYQFQFLLFGKCAR